MIRPNLRSFVAAMACLMSTSAAVHAQYAPNGAVGHTPLIQLPQSTYQAPIVDHYIQGDPNLWDDEQPIEKFVGDVASRSWLRLEFLMWSYRRPGDGIVGAPVDGLERGVQSDQIEGINVPIDFEDELDQANPVGQTLFPTLATVGNEDIPGMRGTLGVALNGAELELSFFGMQQSSDSFFRDIDGPRQQIALQDPNVDPALGTNTNPNFAIPLLNSFQVTDVADNAFGTVGPLNALVFTDALNITMESQIWGSEISLLTDRRIPGGEGPSWQWLGGFRYVNLDETFSIGGTRITGASSFIKSSTINNVYGPEIGGRAAFTTRWITLSATPRVMFGVNDHSSSLAANVLAAGPSRATDRSVDFGTITQLNLATEVHFSSAFSVYGGYDFMWMPSVTRPFENVIYNSTTDINGAAIPDIRQHTNLTNFIAQGFSVGACFRY